MSSSHAALPTRSWKTFARYVAPSVSAMVLFSSYTIIDGIFVSKGVGEIALAAVNISLPFINILSGIAILLSMHTVNCLPFFNPSTPTLIHSFIHTYLYTTNLSIHS